MCDYIKFTLCRRRRGDQGLRDMRFSLAEDNPLLNYIVYKKYLHEDRSSRTPADKISELWNTPKCLKDPCMANLLNRR